MVFFPSKNVRLKTQPGRERQQHFVGDPLFIIIRKVKCKTRCDKIIIENTEVEIRVEGRRITRLQI